MKASEFDKNFVYVNQDGSVRELTGDERQYLSQEFAPDDSGRPYVKQSFESQDGLGSISGFLHSSKLPQHVLVELANPDYVAPALDFRHQLIEESEYFGDIVTENSDGSTTVSPNPDMSRNRRRQLALERQRARERLAEHPQHLRSALA